MKYDKIKRILIVVITITYMAIGFTYQYRYDDETENIEKINISGTYQETEDDLPVAFKSFEDIRSDGYKQLIVKGHFDTDIEKDVKISCPVVRNTITMKINGKECVNTPKDVFVRWIKFKSPGIAKDDDVEIIIKPISKKYSDDSYTYFLENIYAGSETELLRLKIKENWYNLLIGIVTLCLGVGFAVVQLAFSAFKFNGGRNYESCALLLICGSIFSFVNYDYISFLFGKTAFMNVIDFISKILFCGFLFLHLQKYITDKKCRMVSDILFSVWLGVYAVCLVRRIMSIMPYVYAVDMVIVGITAILVGHEIIFYINYLKEHNKQSLLIMVSTMILCVAALFEMILYIVERKFIREIFSTGLLIFWIINFIDMVKISKETVEKSIRAKDLEKQLVNSRMELLVGQIKPHFVFNALNVIEDICVKEPEKAKTAIKYFSTYMKANMNSLADRRVIPFEKEMEHVESYLYIEMLRKGDLLKVEYNLEITDFNIPPLTVQTLVENAVKHGMKGKEGVGIISIRTYLKNNTIYVIVEDNGVGFDTGYRPDDGRKHIGIDNTVARIKNMVNGKVTIESIIMKGTKVTIAIPASDIVS